MSSSTSSTTVSTDVKPRHWFWNFARFAIWVVIVALLLWFVFWLFGMRVQVVNGELRIRPPSIDAAGGRIGGLADRVVIEPPLGDQERSKALEAGPAVPPTSGEKFRARDGTMHNKVDGITLE